jgi:hypothetical protein
VNGEDKRCHEDLAVVFTSTEEWDHEYAKELCAECPETEWCFNLRLQMQKQGTKVIGTWHGQLYGRDMP